MLRSTSLSLVCVLSPLIFSRSLKSLPIIFATSCTLGRFSTSNSPTRAPFLKTVILSHTAYTCSKKCVTNIIPMPSFFSFFIKTKSFSTSPSSSDEVGSSSISTFADISTALAMAIICCIAIE